MRINPLYTRQETLDDNTVVQTQWGYCRAQNAVRLGYCANILVALVGLLLVLHLAREGLALCVLVGASFGCAYVAEQLQPSPLQRYCMYMSILFTIGAYALMASLSLGG